MAKLKFKDENNEFIPVVQDVKVNNSSVFDGKNANIQLDEYVLTVPNFSDKTKISNNDLTYIRTNRPKTLKITSTYHHNTICLNLNEADTYNNLSYSVVMNLSGTYELFSYFLDIAQNDTEQTGCNFFWVGYTVAPVAPFISEGKTFVLKLINGTPTWVEET